MVLKSFFSSPDFIFPFKIRNLQKLHNAWGTRTNQAHEALCWAGRYCWQEGAFLCLVHQAAVGLSQEEQPPGSWEQAVLQEAFQDLQYWPQQCLQHGQVPFGSPLPSSFTEFRCFNTRKIYLLISSMLSCTWNEEVHLKKNSLIIYLFDFWTVLTISLNVK